MNDIDFKLFEELLRRDSGLVVTQDKTYLLESRLLPVAAKFGLQGLEGIASKLRAPAGDRELQRMVIEAMTTNETSFFRDITPFTQLKEDILPYFIKNRQNKTLRIWSSACSSGQEIYSIAMMLKEYGSALAGWKVELIATDLSNDILTQARNGVYSQFEVQRGLPIQMLVKYFTQDGTKWQIKPEIRDMVTFKQANLLADLGTLGFFDIVFCRNVLIYFDAPTKGRVLENIRKVTRPDGFLFLGGAETVFGITDAFKPLAEFKCVYVRSDASPVLRQNKA